MLCLTGLTQPARAQPLTTPSTASTPAPAITSPTVPTAGAPRTAAPAPQGAIKSAPPDQGPALLQAAADLLARQANFAAKIRVRSALYGETLQGSGHYLQGDPRQQQLRYELKLQLTDHISSLLQVADGDYLWIHETVFDSTTLRRVDLHRFWEAARSKTLPAGPKLLVGLAWGGLPRVLRDFDRSFQFRFVSASNVGTTPTWLLDGTWKPAELVHVFPDRKPDLEHVGAIDLQKLPDHLPQRIRLHLERNTLMPRRVEFQRTGKTPLGYVGTPNDDDWWGLVELEIFDIELNVRIDPRAFEYQPGDVEFQDATEQYILSLGQGQQM